MRWTVEFEQVFEITFPDTLAGNKAPEWLKPLINLPPLQRL